MVISSLSSVVLSTVVVCCGFVEVASVTADVVGPFDVDISGSVKGPFSSLGATVVGLAVVPLLEETSDSGIGT